jgi:hypothetical protein
LRGASQPCWLILILRQPPSISASLMRTFGVIFWVGARRSVRPLATFSDGGSLAATLWHPSGEINPLRLTRMACDTITYAGRQPTRRRS